MEFDAYQKKSRVTAIYPDLGKNIVYPTLGLCGEAGEVAEKVKKLIRDRNGVMDAEFLDLLKKELGDVLWYIAQICAEAGFSMGDVADHNLEKLRSRMERQQLHGSGDTR